MMALPEGWVTQTQGLSRAAQLHLLGNSVVPLQAAHALNILLPGGIPSHGQPPTSGDRAEAEEER